MPHAGFAAGLDATCAHRAGWRDGGGGPSGQHEAADTKSWSLVTGYALVALPVPFVRSSRHRILAAVHAGAGSHLDRFSAPRLSGGSNAGDAETLVQPILPAATIDELAPRGYVIADLEYRWEWRRRAAVEGKLVRRTDFRVRMQWPSGDQTG